MYEAADALAPSVQAVPRVPREPVPKVDLSLGTKIEVLWKPKGGGEPTWWAGEVIDILEQKNGVRRHYIKYYGAPESQWFYHNLAAGGDGFEWRITSDDEPAAPQRSSGRRTRSQSASKSEQQASVARAERAMLSRRAFSDPLEYILEATPCTHMYDACAAAA